MVAIDRDKIKTVVNLFKKKKYHFGFALSGGGARGIAHIGVLKRFEEVGVKPDVVAGTSAGAVIGALYCDGYRPHQIKEIFSDVEFRKMTTLQRPVLGFFSLQKFENFLNKKLRAKKIEDLKIPLKIVATDLNRGEIKVFDKGSLIDAVIASSSVPVLFTPKKIDKIDYVDGGVLKNLPATILREDCEKLISVNVSPFATQKSVDSILDVGLRTYHYMLKANIIQDREISDLLVEPAGLADIDTFEIEKMNEIFNIGYNEVVRVFSTDLEDKKE